MTIMFIMPILMMMPLNNPSTSSFFEAKNIAVAILSLSGIGIIGVWTLDIIKGDEVDLSLGFFKAKDEENSLLFWPHWVAEYLTGISLLIGVLGPYLDI